MEIEKPIISLKQLREASPEKAVLVNDLIQKLVFKAWKSGLFLDTAFGLEEILEVCEELIDKGLLRVLKVSHETYCVYYLELWNVNSHEYKRITS